MRMKEHLAESAVAVAKPLPPIVATALVKVWGFAIQDWILILTALYTLLLIVQTLVNNGPKWWGYLVRFSRWARGRE